MSASIFSALAGFSQHDRNLSLAMEIKVTTQVDLKEYHLTNCHIGGMEELFGEEESCSLQIGTQRAYFTESIRQLVLNLFGPLGAFSTEEDFQRRGENSSCPEA